MHLSSEKALVCESEDFIGVHLTKSLTANGSDSLTLGGKGKVVLQEKLIGETSFDLRDGFEKNYQLMEDQIATGTKGK